MAAKYGKFKKHFDTLRRKIFDLITSIYSSASDIKHKYFHGPPVIIRCKRWEDFSFKLVIQGCFFLGQNKKPSKLMP
jgi:hypothetical protein